MGSTRAPPKQNPSIHSKEKISKNQSLKEDANSLNEDADSLNEDVKSLKNESNKIAKMKKRKKKRFLKCRPCHAP